MSPNNHVDIMFLHGWGLTTRVCVLTPCLYSVAEKTGAAELHKIAEVLQKDILNKTVLVAWSLGGLLALQLAELSDKVVGIVFLATAPKFMNDAAWLKTIDEKELAGLGQALNTDTGSALASFITLIAHGDISSRKTARYLQSCVAKQEHQQILSCWLQELENLDLREAYSRLTLPAYVLLAEKDVLINQNINQSLTELNPRIEVDILLSCGHAFFISAAQEARSRIERFINAGIN